MSDKNFVIHGVHEYHGWNEPVKMGFCKHKDHPGKKRARIAGTINGVKACHPCMNEVHINAITWDRTVG